MTNIARFIQVKHTMGTVSLYFFSCTTFIHIFNYCLFILFLTAPFSSGSHYSSLGYDRRPIYSSGRPLDYGLQDYENAYNNGHQTHGFGLNPLYGANVRDALN